MSKALQDFAKQAEADQAGGLKAMLQKVAEFPSRNMDEPISFGAEVKAMAREAVKNVRATITEAMFGHHEPMSEPGTPLNPTPQLVTADLLKSKEVDMDR